MKKFAVKYFDSGKTTIEAYSPEEHREGEYEEYDLYIEEYSSYTEAVKQHNRA